MSLEDIEITKEIMETVALAQLYRDDPILALRKIVKEKATESEMKTFYKRVLQHPDFSTVKSDAVMLESATLIDENTDTLQLYYNKLLKQAQFEKKYEVVTRILKEIRQLKAIDNEQSKFEIIIKLDERFEKGNYKAEG